MSNRTARIAEGDARSDWLHSWVYKGSPRDLRVGPHPCSDLLLLLPGQESNLRRLS